MQRGLTSLAMAAAMAMILTVTGVFTTIAPANAEPTVHKTTVGEEQIQSEIFWDYYSTYSKCRRVGRELLGQRLGDKTITGYDCRWGSPYWSLWLELR